MIGKKVFGGVLLLCGAAMTGYAGMGAVGVQSAVAIEAISAATKAVITAPV